MFLVSLARLAAPRQREALAARPAMEAEALGFEEAMCLRLPSKAWKTSKHQAVDARLPNAMQHRVLCRIRAASC